MATIVLVHGAWGGAHGFKKVSPMLRSSGQSVYTPSLTGIGERSHLSSPMVNLSTHIYDVANTVLFEDLNNITLVGFSYGGMVVSGALQHIADRVKHLVFLDAYVPKDGESADSLRGSSRPSLSFDHDWMLAPLNRRMDNPDDEEWFSVRRSPQPAATFAEPVVMTQTIEKYSFSLNYIKATADELEAKDSAFWNAARMAQNSERWNYFEIASNHMVAINCPDELADILMKISNSTKGSN